MLTSGKERYNTISPSTFQDDFIFIGEEINDEKNVSYLKEQYKTYIKEKVQTSAFY